MKEKLTDTKNFYTSNSPTKTILIPDSLNLGLPYIPKNGTITGFWVGVPVSQRMFSGYLNIPV